MKRCISCKEEKGFEHFSKNRNSKDGYKNYCKKCASKYNKRYREKHKEKVNAKNRAWYHSSKLNKEKRTNEALSKKEQMCSCCNTVKPITEFYKRGNGGFYKECKNCHNKKMKEYTESNREKVLKRKRLYYKNNRERSLEYFKQYSLKNSKRNVERANEWKKKNLERYKFHQNNSCHRRRLKLSEVERTFSNEEWEKCKDFFKNDKGIVECAYCNKELKRPTMEHFIPIHLGGSHTSDNILPVCQSCNSKKSAKNFNEWYPKTDFYDTENEKKIYAYFKTL